MTAPLKGSLSFQVSSPVRSPLVCCTRRLSGRCGQRPLREDRRRVCRGGFYIRPMLPRRMHLRRTLPVQTPERAGSLVQRELARAARLRDCRPPVTASSDPLRHGFAVPPPLGHQGEAWGLSGRRTALHTAVGRPMWASAPTRYPRYPQKSRPGCVPGRLRLSKNLAES